LAAVIILFIAIGYFFRRFEKNRILKEHQSEKNSFMEGLFQNAPFAVAVTDTVGKVTTINDVFEITFGYSKEEILGKKLDEILSDESETKKKNVVRSFSLEEHQKVYQVCKRRCKDGTLLDVELFTTPNFVGSKHFGYLIYYNDISKRLKVEAELDRTYATYRAVLDTLQDSYFEADPNGRLTYVNKAFVNATGYTDKNDVIGKHFRNLVSPETIRLFFKNFKKLYETKLPVGPFDLKYVTKDKLEHPSEIVVSPISENGKVLGTRGIVRDISLRVEAEKMLKAAKEAAEFRADELASINLVAEKVSHSLDLQDILNAVCIELTKIFAVRNAGISLYDPQKNTLEIKAFYTTVNSEEDLKGRVLHLEENRESEKMILSKKTVLVKDVQNDSRTKPISDLSKLHGSGSFVVVPMISRGNVIGALGMPARETDYKFNQNEIELAETIASQIAAAVDNALLHAKTEIALDLAERDLEIGREIQAGFFPRSLPEISGWEIASYFSAARQVSGDFYDVFGVGKNGLTCLVIADVCDKGVGAALFMVLLRSLIRSFAEQNGNETVAEELVLKVADKVNNYIVSTHGQSNMFATLILGLLDTDQNKLYYVNGGHEPAFLLNWKGKILRRLEPTGAAFGFSTDLSFDTGVVVFKEGDSLLAFTDGLTEAQTVSGEFYSDERLQNSISNKWFSAFSLTWHLQCEIEKHIGAHKQFDDITLLALRRSFDDPLFHHFTEKADMSMLPLFRKFAVGACSELKVKEDIIEIIKLAVDEICSNIIMHGYKDMEAGQIWLRVKIENSDLLVEIEDHGHSFDPLSFNKPNLTEELDEREIGGLGIYFVKESVDDLIYERDEDKNRLTLKMKL
jgi:sigma-B regulation protein RsbU (phosphoserine phosphatase)